MEHMLFPVSLGGNSHSRVAPAALAPLCVLKRCGLIEDFFISQAIRYKREKGEYQLFPCAGREGAPAQQGMEVPAGSGHRRALASQARACRMLLEPRTPFPGLLSL